MKRFLVVASSALLFAGPAVAAAKVGRPFRALEGESFGVSYFLTAFAGPGIFRGSERDCHYLVLEAGPWGATGCASARRGLADYGEVCAEPGRFLYGLAPATAAVVRGVTTGGRPFAGRVQPLPARWQSKASAWILAVAPMVSLRSIEALDSHRHVLVRFALAPSQLRCPRVAAHASGRLPGGFGGSSLSGARAGQVGSRTSALRGRCPSRWLPLPSQISSRSASPCLLSETLYSWRPRHRGSTAALPVTGSSRDSYRGRSQASRLSSSTADACARAAYARPESRSMRS